MRDLILRTALQCSFASDCVRCSLAGAAAAQVSPVINLAFDANKAADAWNIYAGLPAEYHTHYEYYQKAFDSAALAYANGSYDDAFEQFSGLGNYSDSTDMAVQCRKGKADRLFADGRYAEAAEVYSEIGDDLNAE